MGGTALGGPWVKVKQLHVRIIRAGLGTDGAARCDWRAAEVKLHAASFPAGRTRLSDILAHARVRPKQMLAGAAHFAGGVNAHENTRGVLRAPRPSLRWLCARWAGLPCRGFAPWCHDRGVIFLRTFWEITAQRGDALDARQLNAEAEAEAEEDAGAELSSAVWPSLSPACSVQRGRVNKVVSGGADPGADGTGNVPTGEVSPETTWFPWLVWQDSVFISNVSSIQSRRIRMLLLSNWSGAPVKCFKIKNSMKHSKTHSHDNPPQNTFSSW